MKIWLWLGVVGAALLLLIGGPKISLEPSVSRAGRGSSDGEVQARQVLQHEPDLSLPDDAASPISSADDRRPSAAAEPVGLDTKQLPTEVPDAFDGMLQFVNRSLEIGRKLKGYNATFEQQVRIDGVLREPEWMDLKFRRGPYSVYLRWHKDRQEALYVDGENDGHLLVRPTRGLIALRGTWKLRPDSLQAMRSARYPVTELGVERLSERVLQFHQDRKFFRDDMVWRQFACLVDGKPTIQFEVVFLSPARSPQYAKSRLTFDGESGLLVGIENFGWNGDAQTSDLLERYFYHDLAVVNDLTDADFNPRNPEYRFY